MPALGVVNMAYLTFSQVADHFQYLALPGLIALLVAGLYQALHDASRSMQPASCARPSILNPRLSPLILIPLAIAILLPLSILTWRYEQIVGHPEALWRHNIQLNPDSWPARNNLARILTERGDYQEAEKQCLAAVAIAPDSPAAYYNLGNAYFYRNKFDEAMRQFSEAVRLAPNDSSSHNNLANALAKRGRVGEAVFHFGEALRLNPNNLEAHSSLANVLGRQGKDEEAKEQYLEVLRLNAGDSVAHNNLGQLLAVEGKLDEALPHFLEAVRLKPDSPEALANLNNLAWILATNPDAKRRNGVQAVQLAERACALCGSRIPPFLDTLAAAYAEAGRFDDAIRIEQRAIEAAEQAGEKTRAAKLRQRLALYRAGQPYRE